MLSRLDDIMQSAQLNINRMYARLLCMSAQINDWSDIHFAYQVARLGTLSAAGNTLNVHHSTVLRRIDALEKRLNTRLFHRHARGYSPTEAGQLLLKVAAQTQEDFDRMLGQLEGTDEQLSGTLVITTVNSFTAVLTPLIAEFQRLHPEIHIEFVADSRIFKLEYGEAHVSIRPGAKPKDPDYVVQHLKALPAALYASESYIKRYGKMKNLRDHKGHRFISSVSNMPNVPYMAWIDKHIDEQQIYYRASDVAAIQEAALRGIGITALTHWVCSTTPALTLLFKPPKDWITQLWLVTHRDIHRTAKVQAFTQFLKMKLSNQPPS